MYTRIMSRIFLGLSIIAIIVATIFFGRQFYLYQQNVQSIAYQGSSQMVIFNPFNPAVKAINFYNLALADDIDLQIEGNVDVTQLSEAELAETDFTITVKDSLGGRDLVLTRNDFLATASIEIVDNDVGTREKGDVTDMLFQLAYTESYRSRRPIYSFTSEHIQGNWYIIKVVIGI